MESGNNQNMTQPQEGTTNPNPQPTNVNMEIDQGLMSLRSIVQDMRSIGGPNQLSLATSLDNIVSSIVNAQGKLTNIIDYKARMFEYYKNNMDKNQVRDLNITKQELMSLFIDPRTGLQPPVTKKRIYMDWCTHQKLKDNWMDEKPPCNNREVPLYFLTKLWAKFILGHHVNYFDIGEFQGVGHGFAQDIENYRCEPVLGIHPPRRRPNPPSQYPPIAEGIMQT